MIILLFIVFYLFFCYFVYVIINITWIWILLAGPEISAGGPIDVYVKRSALKKYIWYIFFLINQKYDINVQQLWKHISYFFPEQVSE